MNASQRWLRWSGFLLGSILLFWLPVEDVNLTAAVMLSAAVCFWAAIAFVKKWRLHSHHYAWAGLIGGLIVGPVGFLLMVFKIGLHSHGTPDFTMMQLLQIVRMSPYSGMSGFFLGWGVHLYRLSRRA
ncbi:MAG TPA: hypothetical protein VI451_06620 [Anaerolineales bacterium]|nr:hypothetical protein [Anaerolineales bacterium]